MGLPTMREEMVEGLNCYRETVLAIKDAMNVLGGKWKLPIISVLRFGKRRF